jgi:dCTP deaminase
MVLSDRSIKEGLDQGRIIIKPFDESCLQPASVDVHLDRKLQVPRNQRHPSHIDTRKNVESFNEIIELEDDKPFFLQPGEFVLVSTLEDIGLPDDIVAKLEGKSSLGRIGLLVNSTAGYVDPGWRGHLTMEVTNAAKLPITLYYGMKIGQITFLKLTTPVDRPYGTKGLGSKYQGQTEPTASRIYRDFQQS